MLNRKLAVGIPVVEETANGNKVKKVANMWMHHVDWVLEQQWSDYKNIAMAWGTSNRNANGEYLNLGKSGEVIRMGESAIAHLAA